MHSVCPFSMGHSETWMAVQLSVRLIRIIEVCRSCSFVLNTICLFLCIYWLSSCSSKCIKIRFNFSTLFEWRILPLFHSIESDCIWVLISILHMKMTIAVLLTHSHAVILFILWYCTRYPAFYSRFEKCIWHKSD